MIADLSEPYSLGPKILSTDTKMVGLGGLEPPTSRLSGVRSNHLSYRPKSLETGRLVELDGFEPTTPCVQSRCSPN